MNAAKVIQDARLQVLTDTPGFWALLIKTDRAAEAYRILCHALDHVHAVLMIDRNGFGDTTPAEYSQF